MRNLILTIFVLIISTVFAAGKTRHLLVFSKTKGFRHESITAGKKMFIETAAQKNYTVDTTEDATVFTYANLKKYNAVVFLNTTGDVLDSAQQLAFEQYIQHGGGFVGIHSATDTEYDWPWYNKLVGAYFDSHPSPQNAHFDVVNKHFPATQNLPDTLNRFEELYNFKSLQKDILHFLITVDEKSYTGGKMNDFHPMSWYHLYDGGKAFYLELGHHPETYADAQYLQILWGGIDWAAK